MGMSSTVFKPLAIALKKYKKDGKNKTKTLSERLDYCALTTLFIISSFEKNLLLHFTLVPADCSFKMTCCLTH